MVNPFSMPKTLVQGRRLQITAILLLITLLGAVLRFYQLGTDSLWGDEIWTAVHADPENDLPRILTSSLEMRVKPPPLYFLITHFFLVFLGESDLIVRLPAAIFGVLGIIATYAVGKLFFGPKVGLIAALLLAISPFHIRYSQEARYYALITLLSLLSLYSLDRAMSDQKGRWWMGYVAVTVAALYTHLFPILFLLAEIAFVACCALQELVRSRVRQVSFTRAVLSLLRDRPYGAFLVSLALISLLYLPWVRFVVATVTGPQGMVEVGEEPGTPITLSFISRMFRIFSAGGQASGLVYLGGFLVGMAATPEGRRKRVLLALLWIGVPLLTLKAMRPNKTVGFKYLIFLMPVYLIFVGHGISQIASGAYRLVGRLFPSCQTTPSPLAILPLLVLLAIFASFSIAPIRENYDQETSNWRDLASFLHHHRQPGDFLVIRKAYGGELKNLRYYDPSYGQKDEQKVEGVQLYFRDFNLEEFTKWYFSPEVTSCEHCRVWVLYISTTRFDPGQEFEHWLTSQSFLIIPFEGGLDLAVNIPSSGGLEMGERIPLMEDAVEVSPRNVGFRLGLAGLYLQEGRPQDALAVAQEALAFRPELDQEAWFHRVLGDLYLASGKAQEAVEEYERLLALNPKLDQRPQFHLRLGKAYEEGGRREEAIREYERVLELQPGNTDAQQALGALDK